MGPLEMKNMPLPQSHSPGQHGILQGCSFSLYVCFSDTSWLIHCPLCTLIDSACSSPSRMVLGDPPPSQVLLWASAASSSSDLPSIPMIENVRGHPYWWPATSRPEGGLSQVRFPFCFISLWLRATRPLGVKSFPSLIETCFWELTSNQALGPWGCSTNRAQSPCSPWIHLLPPWLAMMGVADILACPLWRPWPWLTTELLSQSLHRRTCGSLHSCLFLVF